MCSSCNLAVVDSRQFVCGTDDLSSKAAVHCSAIHKLDRENMPSCLSSKLLLLLLLTACVQSVYAVDSILLIG